MVGSAGVGGGRSKEAVGMMALHETLRNVCLNSDWTYSVFWTIRPRPRCRGGSGCKVGDDNGSLMLMWEDGFCRTRIAEFLEEIDGEDPVRKAFSKMSIQLYNYGEGLMGKVASDKCHKWVFKEPSVECEPNISNYWQSSFDALPPEWTDQFASGIQTIAVIQAGHGLLQLGSCKTIPEDLHFVLRMRHMFESLGYQSGFFLSQLFSSTRTNSPSSSSLMKQIPNRPEPPIFNWTPQIPQPSFHPSPQIGLLPHSNHTQIDGMMPDHESELKWPNGLSFFTALTGRTDDEKLLFGHGKGMHSSNSQMNLCGNMEEVNNIVESNVDYTEDYMGLERNSSKARKMESSGKFKRSFTMPARMVNSSSSSTQQGMEYRSSESGIYSDIMETFLE